MSPVSRPAAAGKVRAAPNQSERKSEAARGAAKSGDRPVTPQLRQTPVPLNHRAPGKGKGSRIGTATSRSAVAGSKCRYKMGSSQGKGRGYLSVTDLENVLNSCKLQLTQIDEVWPNLYIGNVSIAQNRTALQKLGITHILNAAHSKRGSIGDQKYYGGNFVYCGIPADDSSYFDLNVYFRPAADFIHKALKDGKVLVHCIMGMSRSSTLVLAYLMLYHRLSLHNAIQRVIKKRAIYPNRNFLALLLDLDLQLKRKKRICVIS